MEVQGFGRGENSGFPKADTRFWAEENARLRYRLNLLEEYKHINGIELSVASDAEECRILQYQTQWLLATIAEKGKLNDAQQFVESRIARASVLLPRNFDRWWQDHKNFSSEVHYRSSSSGQLDGSYQCYHFGCQNYVTGFATLDTLERHLQLHNISSRDTSEAYNLALHGNRRHIDFAESPSRAASVALTNQEETVPSVASSRPYAATSPARRILSSNQLNSQDPKIQSPAPKTQVFPVLGKRSRPGTETAAQEPCLRCKVLKKGCDDRNYCAGCPARGLEAADHWKALGCVRGPLVGLVDLCLPDRFKDYFSGDESRGDPFKGVTIKVADLEVESWTDGIANLLKIPSFKNLIDPIWKLGQLQSYLADRTDQLPETPNLLVDRDRLLGNLLDYTTSFGLLQLQSEEPYYQQKATYSLFAMLRSGRDLNQPDEQYFLADSQPPHQLLTRELFREAKILLISVIKFYLEHLRIIKLQKRGGSSSDTTFIAVAHLPNVKKYLGNFLSLFDNIFSHRTVLNVADWLGAFYTMCLFSVANSLLIDILSHPSDILWSSEWHSWDAAQMNGMYSALVSTFVWSAKIKLGRSPPLSKVQDPLFQDWSSGDLSPAALPQSVLKALLNTQIWTGIHSRVNPNLNSSKDFLMSLSTRNSQDLKLNGFLAQRYDEKADESRFLSGVGSQFGTVDSAATYADTLNTGVEPSYEPITRSLTFPGGSKSTQRSYGWDQVEPRMKELLANGNDVPAVVNSILKEFFSGTNVQQVPTYNGVKRRVLALKKSNELSPRYSLTWPAFPSNDDSLGEYAQSRSPVPRHNPENVAVDDGDQRHVVQSYYGKFASTPSEMTMRFHTPTEVPEIAMSNASSTLPRDNRSDLPRRDNDRGVSRPQVQKMWAEMMQLNHMQSMADVNPILPKIPIPHYDLTGELQPRALGPHLPASQPPGDQRSSQEVSTSPEGGVHTMTDVTDFGFPTVSESAVGDNTIARQSETYDLTSDDASAVKKTPRNKRGGPLSSASRENAAEMRKIGACASCRAKRSKCDPSHRRQESGEPEKLEDSNFTILADPGNNSQVDVIFVHGMGGDPIGTWTTKDAICWPRDILARQHSNVRVLSFGYRVSKNAESRASYDETAKIVEDFMRFLKAEREDPVHNDTPLILLGHGFGGIIIKSAMVQLGQSFNAKSQNISRCVVGVLFFATPQSESALAVLQRNGLKKQKSPVKVLPKSVTKEYLKTLSENFGLLYQKLPIACFFETRPTESLGDKVLPEAEATLKGALTRRIALDADHMNICKFVGPNDSNYRMVNSCLEELISQEPLATGPA